MVKVCGSIVTFSAPNSCEQSKKARQLNKEERENLMREVSQKKISLGMAQKLVQITVVIRRVTLIVPFWKDDRSFERKALG